MLAIARTMSCQTMSRARLKPRAGSGGRRRRERGSWRKDGDGAGMNAVGGDEKYHSKEDD
jgi:hypothetical protein